VAFDPENLPIHLCDLNASPKVTHFAARASTARRPPPDGYSVS
jgi:hypothetical protein